MIRQVLNIAKKEFILLRRDRRMYPILFIAPIVQLILFGYAATFDVKNVPVAVYSNDNGSIARRYLEMFTASENFVITQ
ncbi:MAG TPA: ABC transporter permease, partial [bacterium]